MQAHAHMHSPTQTYTYTTHTLKHAHTHNHCFSSVIVFLPFLFPSMPFGPLEVTFAFSDVLGPM